MKENVISSMIGNVLRSFMAGMLLPVVATDASADTAGHSADRSHDSTLLAAYVRPIANSRALAVALSDG